MAKWLILITGVVWLVVDIYLDRAGKDTLSQVILKASGRFGIPIIFGVGFICGHLFWPQ